MFLKGERFDLEQSMPPSIFYSRERAVKGSVKGVGGFKPARRGLFYHGCKSQGPNLLLGCHL